MEAHRLSQNIQLVTTVIVEDLVTPVAGETADLWRRPGMASVILQVSVHLEEEARASTMPPVARQCRGVSMRSFRSTTLRSFLKTCDQRSL